MSIVRIVERFHAAMRDKSADDLADLYAEDGVHEFPFRLPGMPERYTGREEIRAGYGLSWGSSPAEVVRVRRVSLHQGGDPDVVVVEHEVDVTVHGRPHTVPGLLVIRARDGRIVHTRDYMDATAVGALRS
ncbi:nuclear transport factor 2 family protein [Herbidospora daliensis]|uniref:nuclear transport factor 2 family protein n=1 Tax=Herbidospora daliensis TaxID=295585 RepID=UPI000AD2A6AA|nr:nuclear transport factor 2 family protein [Herbidospora daliensis]